MMYQHQLIQVYWQQISAEELGFLKVMTKNNKESLLCLSSDYQDWPIMYGSRGLPHKVYTKVLKHERSGDSNVWTIR